MQVFKRYFAIGASILLVLASGSAEQSHNGPSKGPATMPEVSGISSPTMPTVTSPTLGDGFYTPGNDSNPIYTGSSDSSKTAAPATSSQTNTAASTSASTATPQTTTQPSNTNITPTGLLSSLSANDISSLGEQGLLSQLFSTNDTANSTTSLANLYTSSSNSTTNVLLKQVLSELESLKKQTTAKTSTDSKEKSTEIAANKSTATKTNLSAATTTAPHSSLLRFIVNGYDILKTCRIVYISKVQKDGTFLLTGDRRYQSDGTMRTETFYLFFKNNGVVGGQSTYTVAAAVTQDYLNQYSFLYQLAQKDNLLASKTGNLIILRTDDPSWKLDLLLDLEEQ